MAVFLYDKPAKISKVKAKELKEKQKKKKEIIKRRINTPRKI